MILKLLLGNQPSQGMFVIIPRPATLVILPLVSTIFTCILFSGGTVCIEPSHWEESNVSVECDEYGENCTGTAIGYVAAKKAEFEEKGATCSFEPNSNLSCYYSTSRDRRCDIAEGYVICIDDNEETGWSIYD